MMKKSRVVKPWSKHNVPEELCSEILSRLPVKSLLRFRCVSTSWRALIDNPNFARLHLTRFNNNHIESHLFFVESGKYSSAECVLRCSKTLRTTAKLGFLQTDLPNSGTLRTTPAREPVQRWVVCCSIDGLFMPKDLAYPRAHKLMLWNPSIRKTRALPLPSGIIHSKLVYFDFGLGFDPLIKDYKFVRFFRESSVSIYTIGTNTWKTIDFQGKGPSSWRWDNYLHTGNRTFCVRGVLYALVGNRDPYLLNLVSFDLNNERFASSQLPEDQSKSDMYGPALTMVDDGSSLALVYLFDNRGSIWVLESLGDDIKSSSWTQRYSFKMPNNHMIFRMTEFLHLKRSNEILFAIPWSTDKFELTSYNLETRKESILLKRFSLEGIPWPYMESLLLL